MLRNRILKKISSYLLILNFFIQLAYSDEGTCGRYATINYQKVLIDNSSSKKGEGLRFYLDKDPVAQEYLDLYQENGRPRWYHAAFGSLGTLLIISGFARSGSFQESGFGSKRSLIASGALILTINYFTIKTLEFNNERLLIRSIDEYNRRNTPRIYITPQLTGDQMSGSISKQLAFGFGLVADF
jgi:hypothetical protein